MTSRKTVFIIFVIVFGLVAAFFYRGMSVDHRNLPSVLVNQSVPAFSLPSLHDEKQLHSDADLKGKYSVLNVWASWCTTCWHEHTFWAGLAQTDFQLVGLDYRDKPAKAKAFLLQAGDPYTFVIADVHGQLGIDLGIYGTPQTFLINPQGQIIYKHVGPVNKDIWHAHFQPKIVQ